MHPYAAKMLVSKVKGRSPEDLDASLRALADLGSWDGSAQRISLAQVAAGGRGLALIAQETATGRIIALARRDPPHSAEQATAPMVAAIPLSP